MNWQVQRATISGEAAVPGDKSIAHRALMLASLARGVSTLRDIPSGADVHSTASCLRLLGSDVWVEDGVTLVRGMGELSSPSRSLDAGNSGTTMRLLAGILAGQPFTSQLIGDASLSRRPMSRIIEPLGQMGAQIRSDHGHAPLDIQGGNLRPITYTSPVASAQVKSAILLAGLFADGETSVTEPYRSRDHSERMLAALGVPVHVDDRSVRLSGGCRPLPFHLTVPGDISSAAFLLVAGVVSGGSVSISNVGVNPTRTGMLHALQEMGANVSYADRSMEMGEPVATVTGTGSNLKSISLEAGRVPGLVDELPLLVLLATQAHGTTDIRGAAELRVKESDRITAVTRALTSMGADINELPDGFVVRGPTVLHGCPVSSQHDHRIAMMLAVAGSIAHGETVVRGAEAADISFPEFADLFRSLGGHLVAR